MSATLKDEIHPKHSWAIAIHNLYTV